MRKVMTDYGLKSLLKVELLGNSWTTRRDARC